MNKFSDRYCGFKGKVEIFRQYTDGSQETLLKQDNLILNSGPDLMARVLAGKTDSIVNGMYLEYKNTAPTAPTIAEARDTSYYTGLTGDTGFVRVSTLSEPSFSASDTIYSNNQVSFVAITDGTTESSANIVDGTSQFYSAALVAIPDFTDQSTDVLFSASNFTNSSDVLVPIIKVANAQIGVRWTIQFETA
jgi:hypothetical protein